MPGAAGVDGEPGGDTVIADEPQGDGGQQEAQAPFDILGQSLAVFRDLGQIVFRVSVLVALLLRYQLRLVHAEHDDRKGGQHNAPHDGEQGQVGNVHIRGCFVQKCGNNQVDDAAQGAHQVDDGVGLGTQGLWGDVGHQRHGGAAVSTHGGQQDSQTDDKAHLFPGIWGSVEAVGENGQRHHHRDGREGAEQNIGTAAAKAGGAFIGQSAEQRQQEQGEDIVRRHDDAGNAFSHVEGFCEDLGDQVVVHLPEGADGQKRETDQYGAFGVELHKEPPFQSIYECIISVLFGEVQTFLPEEGKNCVK